MGRADILVKKLSDYQVDIGMVVIHGILDLDYKQKLLLKCTRSKSFTFSTVKTLVKALYFFREKNNLFNPSYREVRNIGLPLSIQLTEKLGR